MKVCFSSNYMRCGNISRRLLYVIVRGRGKERGRAERALIAPRTPRSESYFLINSYEYRFSSLRDTKGGGGGGWDGGMAAGNGVYFPLGVLHPRLLKSPFWCSLITSNGHWNILMAKYIFWGRKSRGESPRKKYQNWVFLTFCKPN